MAMRSRMDSIADHIPDLYCLKMLTGEAYTKTGIRRAKRLTFPPFLMLGGPLMNLLPASELFFIFFAEYDKVSLQNYGGKEQGGVIGL